MSDVYVRVQVGPERYALPVSQVLEVGVFGAITPVPGASSTAFGVLNLRGQIVPVFDLAAVLGVAREGTPTRVVVADAGDRRAGLAVDAVEHVRPLAAEPEPAEAQFVSGQVREGGAPVGLLDVEPLLELLDTTR